MDIFFDVVPHRYLGSYLKIAITTGVVAAVSMGWFFLTMLFYRKDKKPYVDQAGEFFTDMATPVQANELELGQHDNESRQYNALGNLCLVYGDFILLLMLIPNERAGRLIILCCGAIITGIGWILKILAKRTLLRMQGSSLRTDFSR